MFGNLFGSSSSGGGASNPVAALVLPADPKEQVKKWKSEMRSEQRKVDRQIRSIQREEDKIKRSIKEAAKRGDTGTAKMLAKEIVRSRKATTRMHTSKAQMNSVVMQMENQLAQQKVTGHMQKSTEVMRMMNKLAKVSEMQETMQAMQKEMCTAGVIEEMVDDAFEVLDGDDDEDAADEEVERVMTELNAETMSGSKSAPTSKPVAAEAEEEEEEDMSAMRERLEQLKGTA
eukprot:CAMPEP_0174726582 /NCGR_PEP_ID=MMETSP1094-20130205/48087_1 /TAXON_ID=156173 /ORGANISM="Chrysochromulina brevifilum, Strain UTEX LB 985" /LENGTH=230 /DNA_ID=CAMNT_0015928181 /DNA_START=33 /DNA_END=725 /DNA_ORIENTATION=+